MPVSAGTLKMLMDAGLSGDQLLAVVASIDADMAAPSGEPYVRRLPADWRERRSVVLRRDGETCRYCRTTVGPWEIDHVVPLRLGGSHDLENLAVACVPCNRSKKDRPLDAWRNQ